jgi:hypothetical protein
MLCIMHDGTPYGHLMVNHVVNLEVNLHSMTGLTSESSVQLLRELETAGVFSRRSDGVIFCRRMVRDEELRIKRSEAGHCGGNPKLMVNQEDNHVVNQEDNHVVNQEDNHVVNQQDKQFVADADAVCSSSIQSVSVWGVRGGRSAYPTEDEALAEAEMRGIPAASASKFWAHFEAMGWVDKNGNPIASWRQKLRTWWTTEQERTEKEANANRNRNRSRTEQVADDRNRFISDTRSQATKDADEAAFQARQAAVMARARANSDL